MSADTEFRISIPEADEIWEAILENLGPVNCVDAVWTAESLAKARKYLWSICTKEESK